MDHILTEKIRIGISACNFGAKVRWDAHGWNRFESLGRQKFDYIWTPVCPEVMSGLGVPRKPMRLTGSNGDDFWNDRSQVRNRLGQNVSELLKQGCLDALSIIQRANVDAFVFMEGSPTCGVYRTTLKDKRLGKPPGAFGSLLLKQDLFLIPAEDLESPWKWWDWSRRLHAFVWLKRQEILSKNQLYEIWHLLKFMCQEVDDPAARIIGTDIANAPKKLSQEYIDSWKKRAFTLIRKPSTLNRICAVMAKHYAHYRRQFGYKVEDIKAPEFILGKRKFVDELEKVELKALEQGYQFGGHPVFYRPNR